MSRSSPITGDATTAIREKSRSGMMLVDHEMDSQSQKVDLGHINEDLYDQEGDNAHSDSSGLKRRRVTRACDECRRKKIKCDGKVRV